MTMMRLDDRYADLLGAHEDHAEQAIPARARLIRDLDAAYRVAPPAHLRASVAHALDRRAAVATVAAQEWGQGQGQRQGRRSRRARVQPSRRARLASIAAAVALTLGGIMGYLRLQAPTPASAAVVILRHAMGARLAATPDQVIHQTGTLYVNGPFDLPDQKLFTSPMTTMVDQWTQLDATGAISRQATTITASSGALVAHGLQVGRDEQIYGALHNAVSTETASQSRSYAWLANPLGIGDIPALLAAAQTSSRGDPRLLPRQTLDGALVDVVQITTTTPDSDAFPHRVGPARAVAQLTTMYIDAHDYTLRGVDVSTVQASRVPALLYSVRLTRSDLVPLASVPAGTFTFDAPVGARYLPPAQSPTLGAVTFSAATLLLAHAPAGLQLGELNHTFAGQFSSIGITYCGDTRCHDLPPGSTQFVISFAQTQPPSAHLLPLLAVGQRLTLAIAGVPVRAYYVEEPAPLGARRLVFQQGTTTVELYSQGLDKGAFFAAMGALVDTRTHSALVPGKWRQDAAFAFLR